MHRFTHLTTLHVFIQRLHAKLMKSNILVLVLIDCWQFSEYILELILSYEITLGYFETTFGNVQI